MSKAAAITASVLAVSLAIAPPARATEDAVRAELERLKALVEAQSKQLEAQSVALAQQQRALDSLTLRMAVTDRSLEDARAAGAPVPPTAGAVFAIAQAAPARVAAGQASGGQAAAGQAESPRPAPLIPTRPVGEAPPEREAGQVQQEVLPEGMGVTLQRGRFVLEPAVDYIRTSNNRLVFRGQPIVSTLFVGIFEVSDADRDTVAASLTGRLGITRNIEIEARVPFLYRNDFITAERTISAAGEVVRLNSGLESSGLGDIEVGARYQLTRGQNGGPIWLAGLRVKSDSGTGPLDVEFDQFGVAQELATGSGYWSVEPSITFLMPSDPAVLFASLSYGFNLARTVDRQIAAARPNPTPGLPDLPPVFLRSFDPGDAVSFGFGFGFALNDRFSYTLAYRHSVVLETETILDTGPQSTPQLQVGSFTVLGSYRLSPKTTVNLSVDVGVTNDAPDLRLGVRVPIRF